MDEKIQLGPRAQVTWVKGSSGGAKASDSGKSTSSTSWIIIAKSRWVKLREMRQNTGGFYMKANHPNFIFCLSTMSYLSVRYYWNYRQWGKKWALHFCCFMTDPNKVLKIRFDAQIEAETDWNDTVQKLNCVLRSFILEKVQHTVTDHLLCYGFFKWGRMMYLLVSSASYLQ